MSDGVLLNCHIGARKKDVQAKVPKIIIDINELLYSKQKYNINADQDMTELVEYREDELVFLQPPYLPPLEISQQEKYILVCDLDETLIHYQEVKKTK